jgi:hypothetical protein
MKQGNNTIIMTVYSRLLKKLDDVYLNKDEILSAIQSTTRIVSDVYSYVEIHSFENKLFMRLTLLQDSSINSHYKRVKGIVLHLNIDLKKLLDFFENEELLKQNFLSKENSAKSKVILHTSLADILSDKKIKRQFIKKIVQFTSRERITTFNFYADFIDKSFYFTAFYKDKFVYNGGLIYHTQHTEKPYYSIHT